MSRTDEENLEKLRTAYDQVLDRLNQVTATPKLTYDIDGQKFNWTEYTKMLQESAANLRKQIDSLTEPFEAVSVLYPL